MCIRDSQIQCPNPQAQQQLGGFLTHVPVNACGQGVECFLNSYLEQLLTYGTAVGEMVVGNGAFQALYNAPLEDIPVSYTHLDVYKRQQLYGAVYCKG